MLRENTGYKDKHGTHIYTGDIVRFYWDADKGYGDQGSGFTEMIDVVCRAPLNKNEFGVFCGAVESGAHVWRHNEYCEIIGDIERNHELLTEFSPEFLAELFPDVFGTPAI